MNFHILLHLCTQTNQSVPWRRVWFGTHTTELLYVKAITGPPSTATSYCINRWSTISLIPTSDLTSWTRSAHTRPPLCGNLRNTRCVCCKRRRQGGKSPLMSASSQVSLVPSFCPKYSDPSTHTPHSLFSLSLEPLETLMVNLRLFLNLTIPRSLTQHFPNK